MVPVLVLLATGIARGAGSTDLFNHPDDKSVQAAWQAMWGTAPVSVAEVEGARAVRFPCTFSSLKGERASWDASVRLDLAAGQALRFKFFSRDPSPVGHFTLFFQSGDGWYAASFASSGAGWQTVTVWKDEFKMEERPGGWSGIRTVRISAWRGGDADTEFFLRDFEVIGRAAPIAVVRGESVARNSPGETESVCQFSATVARMLRDLGLDYSLVSDLDLSAERLSGVRAAILPHNPAMPDAAAETLARFASGGGKLIVFYAMPEKLRAVVGIERGRHVREERPGQFSSIHFADGALAGAPAVVGQASWNIQEARPVEGRSRIVAEWFDRDGKDTALAAVVASDNCIYMTHVLLTDDLAAKRRMLLAMVGRFEPEAWKQAAGAGLDRLAEFDERFSRTVRPAAIPPQQADGFAKSLNEAKVKAVLARGLVKEGKCIESLDTADAAHRLYVQALCLAQRSVPGEHRAFWCHSAFGVQNKSWDEAIKILADNGFTAILPNMLWGGSAYYESKVLPVAPEVKERGDQVAACVAACRKYGVQCHVWKVNWNMGGRAPREFADRMKREGRTQVGFDLKPLDAWLCPSHPENQKLELDSMLEVATRYDVDGIHFDYIRYPDADHCFCGGCRERFEAGLGSKVAAWPADVRRGPALAAKWQDFRRANITRLVAAVSEAVRKARPRVKISAAVFANWPVDRDGVGQDWRLWCERGYLDFVCPMDYTPHAGEFEGLVRKQLKWAGRVPCYPGIGLATWTPSGDVCRLIDFIEIARRAGAPGFTVFEYRAAEASEVVPLCGLGITRKSALPAKP
jgi:uncharacterized lipoprotein YddW (UPF0748 family)